MKIKLININTKKIFEVDAKASHSLLLTNKHFKLLTDYNDNTIKEEDAPIAKKKRKAYTKRKKKED